MTDDEFRKLFLSGLPSLAAFASARSILVGMEAYNADKDDKAKIGLNHIIALAYTIGFKDGQRVKGPIGRLKELTKQFEQLSEDLRNATKDMENAS